MVRLFASPSMNVAHQDSFLTMALVAALASDALTAGSDSLRLAPTWVTVQGTGRIDEMPLQSPVMTRFGDTTKDEVFVVSSQAAEGVTFENTGAEPLVGLRYFGPDAQSGAPAMGAYES